MNVTGIIAEYNPFHNGHLYQIQKVRENGADYIVVVMSGDFLQRGVPAMMDKYARAKMALQNGADLVIELPALYATGSAWYFARGGVSLLDKLNVIDTICFGCESDTPQSILQSADILAKESDDFKREMQKALKAGNSFPKARELALKKIANIKYPSDLSNPNNILALEYCLALKERNSNISPYPIKREGSSYHDTALTAGNNPSASAIRELLMASPCHDKLISYVPQSVYDILTSGYNKQYPICQNDFSSLLKYKILLEGNNGFEKFGDISASLSDKIIKYSNQFTTFDSFCQLLKSKDITYSRISRSLIHILLHITQEQYNYYKSHDYTYYARILGLKKEASPLLSQIKKKTSIPLISKLADSAGLLSDEAQSLFELDILSSHIYESVVSERYQTAFQNEYTRQIISF